MSRSRAGGEFIGVLGVVGSLIFVGLEVRQNTAVARGQARQDLAALQQEWLTLLSADSAYSELYYRGWSENGEIAAHEENRFRMMAVLEMRKSENVFFQHQQGLVDDFALRSYGLQALDMTNPRFRDWWVGEDWRSAFHPDFVAFLEDREGGAP